MEVFCGGADASTCPEAKPVWAPGSPGLAVGAVSGVGVRSGAGIGFAASVAVGVGVSAMSGLVGIFILLVN